MLINVSDIRYVPLGSDCAMRLLFDARPYLGRSDEENQKAFLGDWCRREFGPEAADRLAAVYADYFNIPYMRADRRDGETAVSRRFLALYSKTAEAIESGRPSFDLETLNSMNEQLIYTEKAIPYLRELSAKAQPLLNLVPAERRDFYRAHLLTQIDVHLDLNTALDNYTRSLWSIGVSNEQQAVAEADKAVRAMDHLLAVLRRGEYGKWQGWYQGECLLGVEANRDLLRRHAAALRGEPLPPVRPRDDYPYLYRYQLPFQKNFPLMYPPKS